MIYFDNNSTTQMLPQVKNLLHSVIDAPIGNPEALGSINTTTKYAIENSRDQIAKFLGSTAEHLVFTSSGSEANTMGILSALLQTGKKKIVCSQIEHASISELLQFLSMFEFVVEEINTLPSGLIDYDHATSLIDHHTAVVVLQLVNNETGVIQPVSEIAALSRQVGALFHCDGAQAVGKTEVAVESLGCDFFSFTAHKFHGPKGVGALWIKDTDMNVYPLIPGGSQENGKRGGTHNVIGIIGMGAAAKYKQATLTKALHRMRKLRDLFELLLKEQFGNRITINGSETQRIANTSNVQFLDIDGKILYLRLLQEDIICSQSSACTAQYPEPSTTLVAMGLTHEEAFNSIRFSFSELNTKEEVLIAVNTITKLHKKIHDTLGGKY